MGHHHPFVVLVIGLLMASVQATETQSATYTADWTTNFPNPERGWHANVNLIGGSDYAAVRTQRNMTLARAYVRLDDYRNSAIPSSVLAEHTQRFAEVRAAGIKLILRYTYNFDGAGEDASLPQVLAHIGQLKPYWQANADVIAVLQAGFIGAWGEWHDSANHLDAPANEKIITDALLAALPAGRMVQIRYPQAISDHYQDPLQALGAFSGSSQSRIGMHDDSFVRNLTDAGTYVLLPSWDFAPAVKTYTANISPFVVMGGETVEDVPSTDGNRQSGAAAMGEMALLHWDYLNQDYAQSVIGPWVNDGTYDTMSLRMGYRLRLSSAILPKTATSGALLGHVRLVIANDGWGKVYNPRPIVLILRNRTSAAIDRVTLSDDVRTLLPTGGGTTTLDVDGRLPAMAAGSYDVLLQLPDPASAIADRPEYCIRLANDGLWDHATGFHDLHLQLQVSTAVGDTPSGLDSRDIGSPGLAGSASGDGDAITIRGAGADIWNRSDSLHYASQPAAGDAEIVVQVTAQTATDPWAKAGIMFRESTAADARHVSLFVTSGNGIAFQFRGATSGGSSHMAGPRPQAQPWWLKLRRTGNAFIASSSSDGTNWTAVGTRTVALPANALVGLAVTSRTPSALCTATFAHYLVTPAASN